MLGPLGASWDVKKRLPKKRTVLGRRFGAILGPLGAILGPSWGYLGAILGSLGAILGPFWGNLGATFCHLSRKEAIWQNVHGA